MNTLKHYGKIYFLLVSQYMKTRMQYRSDFFISLIGLIITNLSGIVTFWIVFQSVDNINGYNYHELIFMYALSLLVMIPQELLFNNIWYIEGYLIEGSFIKFYLRPLNMMFYYMSDLFDAKGLGQLGVGIVALVYSSASLGIAWTPLKVLLLIGVIFNASLIIISMMSIASFTSFWFLRTNPILQLTANLRDYSRYPISIYNKYLRFVFSFIIPIGFVSFYPSHLFLRPDNIIPVVYLGPVVGIIMFMISYTMWRKGTKNYYGTGS